MVALSNQSNYPPTQYIWAVERKNGTRRQEGRRRCRRRRGPGVRWEVTAEEIGLLPKHVVWGWLEGGQFSCSRPLQNGDQAPRQGYLQEVSAEEQISLLLPGTCRPHFWWKNWGPQRPRHQKPHSIPRFPPGFLFMSPIAPQNVFSVDKSSRF